MFLRRWHDLADQQFIYPSHVGFDDGLDCYSMEVCYYLCAHAKNRAEMLNSNISVVLLPILHGIRLMVRDTIDLSSGHTFPFAGLLLERDWWYVEAERIRWDWLECRADVCFLRCRKL